MTHKKTLAIMALLLLGLTACNTMSGAGRDMRAAGDKLEDTSESNKHY